MTKLFIFLLLLTLLSITALWFAENDGSVIIEWMGYRIQTSMAVTCLAGVIIIVLCAMILHGILWIKNYPSKYKKELQEKRRNKGLTALTQGFAAIAAGDSQNAKRLAKKATHNLGPIPLTKLLSAQTAQLEGNTEQARIDYTAMLENKETEMIAIKGLLIQARQEGDLSKAIFLAEKALDTRPDAQWAISILIDLYKHTRQWDKAEKMIERAIKKKYVNGRSAKRDIALICLAKALDKQATNQTDLALKLIQKSYKLLPDFVPIIATYAQLLMTKDQQRKAIHVLESGWKLNPHPDIASAYMNIFSGEPTEKRMQRAEKLYHFKPEYFASNMVVATTAIATQNYSKARNHLKIALSIEENSSACRLMAELERQENASSDIVMKWENRAETAAAAPTWSCQSCGYVDQNWHIHCTHCESFDSLRWGLSANNEDSLTPSTRVELLAQA